MAKYAKVFQKKVFLFVAKFFYFYLLLLFLGESAFNFASLAQRV